MFKTIIRRLIFWVAIAFVSFYLITSGSGCASIVPPTGGPRDSLPPILLDVNPADSTLNFKSKKIVFSFDEYVEVDEVQKNLLVSPTPKTNPIVTNKLKTITIQIKDTLEPNTTYSFDFGNALKDLNEGNVYRNFTYLFSTGKHLDSLTLSGRVLVAETGKADSTLVVLLYKDLDDSAVIKERSRYVARVDSTGFFRFKYLEPGTFRVYALKDEGARRYFSKTELFAFLDSPVTSQSQRTDLALYAFAEKKEQTDTASSISSSRSKKKPAPTDKVLKIQNNLTDNKLDLLSNPEIFVIEDPFKTLDTTKIHLLSEKFEPLARYKFQRDSTNKKVAIVYPWKENTVYNILLDSAFAQDTMGRQVFRLDTIKFQTKKLSEYGSMKLRFLKLDLKLNPILLLLQDNKIKYTHIFKNNEFNAEIFQPGDYDVRIVLDANKNGVWDTGEFFVKHKQPEKVVIINRKLNVKPNWVTEVDITL